MTLAPTTRRVFDRRARVAAATAAAMIAALVGLPAGAGPDEPTPRAKASDPGATVGLLTAPHTGEKICDIADRTPLQFVRRADHGPHRYAEVEVLDGDCAGKRGYVPLLSMEPRPRGR